MANLQKSSKNGLQGPKNQLSAFSNDFFAIFPTNPYIYLLIFVHLGYFHTYYLGDYLGGLIHNQAISSTFLQKCTCARQCSREKFECVFELLHLQIQKLFHFEVHDFWRISHKRTDKIGTLTYFTPNVSAPSILVQISSNLHRMTTPYSGIKFRRLF